MISCNTGYIYGICLTVTINSGSEDLVEVYTLLSAILVLLIVFPVTVYLNL